MACGLAGPDGAVVRASLVGVKGSSPREAGAMMLITPHTIWQTIGGGTLEHQVMSRARDMMNSAQSMTDSARAGWHREVMKAVLGPDMGQCCGGQVRVLLEHFGPPELTALAALQDAPFLTHPLAGSAPVTAASTSESGLSPAGDAFTAPVIRRQHALFLYGAGHIGRALAPHLVALECDLNWVDINADRFPDTLPAGANKIVASDPAVIAGHAPPDAMHLVITHNHALDEAICLTILKRAREAGGGFARLGLIGSDTKSARFRSRLSRAGVEKSQLARLICPVGLPDIGGKQPARVALSIAAGVAIWQQELDADG